MPSPFAAAAALAETAIDGACAETFSFAPRSVPVNGASQADNSRPAVASFPALFDAGGAYLPAAMPAGFGPGQVQRTVAEAQIIIAKTHVPVLRHGDRVTRTATAAVYEIHNPRPAGHDRWAAFLRVLP